MYEHSLNLGKDIGAITLARFKGTNLETALKNYGTKGWKIKTHLQIPKYEAESVHEVHPHKFVVRGPVTVRDGEYYVVAVLTPKAKFRNPEITGQKASDVLGYFVRGTNMEFAPVGLDPVTLKTILES
tara:strand:+ start:246 stop:629 length:384 start_codon:yes stop_codon:yes gene_type:complete